MTGRDAAHHDVAAYALGVLDEWDSALFEQHLSECPRCRGDLDSLHGVTGALSEADADAVRQLEQAGRADHLVESVRTERARQSRRQLVTAGAGVGAAAVVAALALFAGGQWFGDTTVVAGPEVTPPAVTAADPFPQGIGGPDIADGERFSVTDPATGIHVDVVAEPTEWGTLISFALSGVTGPGAGQLVVEDHEGAVEKAATWQVPDHGYGTAEHPPPLLMQATTAIRTSDVRLVEIQVLGTDGPATLVTVPF